MGNRDKSKATGSNLHKSSGEMPVTNLQKNSKRKVAEDSASGQWSSLGTDQPTSTKSRKMDKLLIIGRVK